MTSADQHPDPRLPDRHLGHRPGALRGRLHRAAHDGEQGTRPFGTFSGEIVTGAAAHRLERHRHDRRQLIDTDNDERDDHIRSADFFEVDNHPTWTYRSTGVRADGDDYVVDGELTIKGVTRPVPLTSSSAASARTPTAASAPASRPPPRSTAATSASTFDAARRRRRRRRRQGADRPRDRGRARVLTGRPSAQAR